MGGEPTPFVLGVFDLTLMGSSGFGMLGLVSRTASSIELRNRT